jgi:SAM-dependent methyltransferase
MPEAPIKPGQQGFNKWHADVARSAACDLIVRQALALPEHAVSNSLLPWSAVPEIAGALRLRPGRTLADLACGRGSYGRELARRASARLIGIDFSEVALAAAARDSQPARDSQLGRDSQSAHDSEPGRVVCFAASDFTAIGLRDGSVDAVVCVDSVQFSDPPVAALRECLRILAPGGRLAVTAWEATDPSDERLPERIRRMDLARDLAAAGFSEIEVAGKPDWHETERTLWESLIRADPAGDPGDPGLDAFRDEAARALDGYDRKRRVLATATAPAGEEEREGNGSGR